MRFLIKKNCSGFIPRGNSLKKALPPCAAANHFCLGINKLLLIGGDFKIRCARKKLNKNFI